jgi:hypothetical protein
MKYYKLLDDAGVANRIKWNIAGGWMEAGGEIVGFQVLSARSLVYCVGDGFNLYEVEIIGDQTIKQGRMYVEYVRVVRQIPGYSRESLLSKVVFPAVNRAQKYVDKSHSTSAYAIPSQYAQWAKDEADVAEAVISTSASSGCVDLALRYSARAAGEGYMDNIQNIGSERKIQIEDILKLLNNA